VPAYVRCPGWRDVRDHLLGNGRASFMMAQHLLAVGLLGRGQPQLRLIVR
jgi:hypothetical protein